MYPKNSFKLVLVSFVQISSLKIDRKRPPYEINSSYTIDVTLPETLPAYLMKSLKGITMSEYSLSTSSLPLPQYEPVLSW